MVQLSGIEILQRVGVFERVLAASGSPPITDCYMKFEDVDLSGPPRLRAGDPPVPMLCVRRITLDIHLVEAAREAGVDLRLHTRVTGLLERAGRVRGVRGTNRDGRVSDI